MDFLVLADNEYLALAALPNIQQKIKKLKIKIEDYFFDKKKLNFFSRLNFTPRYIQPTPLSVDHL
jgi:hypothetical protein